MFKAFGKKKEKDKLKEVKEVKGAEKDKKRQVKEHSTREHSSWESRPDESSKDSAERYRSSKQVGPGDLLRTARAGAQLQPGNAAADKHSQLSDEVRETAGRSLTSGLPDYMADANAVLADHVEWRYGNVPDYTPATRKFQSERTNVWPAGSLEDLVQNLVKNWEKEASYKTKLEDWRTINTQTYRFSCNGGRDYTADEMMKIGTYNALIQEAAFYSAKHTTYDDSHKIFRNAMPDGFPWEVVEVYSGPPVIAFKWRHWGKMTGKLVCPVGPDTKLEAEPTNAEVELFGICVAHMDSDLKLSKLEIFYDPHELMSSLVDARNLSYSTAEQPQIKDGYTPEGGFTESSESTEDEFMSNGYTLTQATSREQNPNHDDFIPPHMLVNDPQASTDQHEGKVQSDNKARRERELIHASGNKPGQGEEKLGIKVEDKDMPSDDALLSALLGRPQKALKGSRCPFPHQ